MAERTGGVIINADSAQVYADLRVLSARPGADETARAEHRLFGFRDAALPFSAADWAEAARGEVRQAQAGARLPILVGGTGLYLRTLLDGIAPVPPIDPAIRTAVRARGVEENLAELQRRDEVGAERLRPTDAARIARALEVVLSTGRPLAEWQAKRSGGIGADMELRALVLLPPRPWLYRRCDERFTAMIEEGAVDEVRLLLARGLDPSLPAMRAIGVREIAALLAGELSREEALAAGCQATRNYAKRQYTWFAHQPPPEWPRFPEPLDGRDVAERALALLGAAG
ncbi:MAG: tRNA dimethylallyltransferase [uncultured Sphingomonas sp.]|uniref:tRNA dimethylallyltransferase n=1 Tax=uncultured Sphingomonas sp. TaxID=158754 RepID=A0A6J4TQQ1_9SPHN|nr:MAG: tRNA dimethylallyltransferase [uncultured Sphingomonas sp.]